MGPRGKPRGLFFGRGSDAIDTRDVATGLRVTHLDPLRVGIAEQLFDLRFCGFVILRTQAGDTTAGGARFECQRQRA